MKVFGYSRDNAGKPVVREERFYVEVFEPNSPNCGYVSMHGGTDRRYLSHTDADLKPASEKEPTE